MLSRPDSPQWDDIVADAAIAVVRVDGTSALTVKNLAEWIGVTPPALHKRYGSRDQLVGIVLETVTDRWCSGLREAVLGTLPDEAAAGLAALMPLAATSDELRAWRALESMAATDPRHHHLARAARTVERDLVARVLAARQLRSSCDVEIALATLHGLRDSICADETPNVAAILGRLCTLVGPPDVHDAA